MANTVGGMLLAGATDGVDGELFVVGSGVDRSVGDVVDAVAEALGQAAARSRSTTARRPADSEVDRLLCDHTKATERLGYEPTVSFADGLAATIEWMAAAGQRRRRGVPGVAR